MLQKGANVNAQVRSLPRGAVQAWIALASFYVSPLWRGSNMHILAHTSLAHPGSNLPTLAPTHPQDNDWWTPLHAASACGHWRVAQTLLNAGANVAAINADGDMPIDLVEGERLEDILKAEMETQGVDEAKIEQLRKQPEADFDAYVADVIAKKGDLNAKDEKGATMVGAAPI